MGVASGPDPLYRTWPGLLCTLPLTRGARSAPGRR